MTTTNQMELGLSSAQRLTNSLHHRQRRLSRAKWWFTQMRHAVDTAMEWQPAPAARPEQTYFAETRLSARVDTQRDGQIQICE